MLFSLLLNPIFLFSTVCKYGGLVSCESTTWLWDQRLGQSSVGVYVFLCASNFGIRSQDIALLHGQVQVITITSLARSNSAAKPQESLHRRTCCAAFNSIRTNSPHTSLDKLPPPLEKPFKPLCSPPLSAKGLVPILENSSNASFDNGSITLPSMFTGQSERQYKPETLFGTVAISAIHPLTIETNGYGLIRGDPEIAQRCSPEILNPSGRTVAGPFAAAKMSTGGTTVPWSSPSCSLTDAVIEVNL